MTAHADSDSLASRARVRRAAGALRRLFESRPAGLITDVDGTISHITSRTSDATVSPVARRALTRLSSQLDLVAVVTGRAVERAQRMVGVAEVGYVGNHGLEWLHDGMVQTDPAAEAARPHLEAALAAVRTRIRERDLTVEDKRVSVAIHYRLAENPEQVEHVLLDALRPFVAAGTLRLIEGRLVVNLLPALAVDKGTAARRLVEQYGLRAVVFLGDDITDLDAFRALRALQATGAATVLTIGVGSAEGPAAVRAEADLMLEGVGEVERLLAALAAQPLRRGLRAG